MDEPKNAMDPQDPELEFADAGWDPYVASLLLSGGELTDAHSGDDDEDSAPVMTLSPGGRGGK